MADPYTDIALSDSYNELCTLRAKIAQHLVKVQVEKSKQQLQSALAAGTLSGADDPFGNIPPLTPETPLGEDDPAPGFGDFEEPSTQEFLIIPGDDDDDCTVPASEYSSPPKGPLTPGRHAWPPTHPEWEADEPDWLDILFPRHVKFNVGIVGAGMTGLYVAMILDDLDPCKIKYEILEASDRPGGRIYTHYFDPTKDGDYYDVGAMRFPNIPIMRRTFDLFKRLEIKKDVTPEPKQGTLIPYYFNKPQENYPKLYNNINSWVDETPPEDVFKVSVKHCGTVPNQFMDLGWKKILNEVFKDWKSRFICNFPETIIQLMELDSTVVTMRQKVIECLKSFPPPRPPVPLEPEDLYYTSNWCENMGGSTGSFDTGFFGNLIHSLEFDWPARPDCQSDPLEETLRDNENLWWCINGGADIITRKMLEKVKRKSAILYNHKVTKMELQRNIPNPKMIVQTQVSGTVEEKLYTHVINTTSFGCAQTMDLCDAGLNYAQREAIRVLGYARAVKVGIKFKRRWWATDLLPENRRLRQGGVGTTDRPTRTVVYPSYALNTPTEDSGVLLACYNTSQDAGRLGALLQGSDASRQELLYNCIIKDLADLHEIDEALLRSLTISYHVHNWGSDPLTRGSWGEFGPGQYSTFFGNIQRCAARGHLFFGSEATSIYPGWIVGSLNSAYRCVRDMLLAQLAATPPHEPHARAYICYLLRKLSKNWGGEDWEPKTEQETCPDVKGVEGWQIWLGIMGPELGL